MAAVRSSTSSPPCPGQQTPGAYGAPKAAANSLRTELAGPRTQVVDVHLSYTDTDMTRGLNVIRNDAADVTRPGWTGSRTGAAKFSPALSAPGEGRAVRDLSFSLVNREVVRSGTWTPERGPSPRRKHSSDNSPPVWFSAQAMTDSGRARCGIGPAIAGWHHAGMTGFRDHRQADACWIVAVTSRVKRRPGDTRIVPCGRRFPGWTGPGQTPPSSA
jgi:hypothetical protein